MLILVFLGLSVLDLGPMYATDRQTSDAHLLMPPPYGVEHNKEMVMMMVVMMTFSVNNIL